MNDLDTNNIKNRNRDIIGKKRQASKFFQVIFLSWIFIKIRGLIFNKIFTNYLSKDDFGNFNFYLKTATFLGSVSTVGVQSAVFRYTSLYSENNKKKKIGNLFLMAGIITTTVYSLVVGCYLISIYIGIFSFANYSIFLVLAIGFYGFFYLLFILINSYIKAQRRTLSYVIINVVVIYANLGLALFFVFLSGARINELMFSYLASLSFFVILYVIKIFLDSGLGDITKDDLMEILRYSSPYFVSFPILQISNYILYYLLDFYHGGVAMAFFVLALSTAGFLNIIDSSMTSAYHSLQFSLFDSKQHLYLSNLNEKVMRIFLAFLIPIILALWYNSPIVILLLSNESFITSDTYYGTLILSCTFFFKAILLFIGQGAYLHRKTKIMAILNSAASITTIFIGIVLIPVFGILGMCLSLLADQILRMIIISPYSQKNFKMKVPIGKLFLLIIPTSLFIVITEFLITFFDLFPFFAIIPSLIIYLSIILLLKIVSINETKLILTQIIKS